MSALPELVIGATGFIGSRLRQLSGAEGTSRRNPTIYPDNYFGYAVAGEILEHLEYPEKFIKETMRILRPGGTLALSTPKDELVEPGAVDKDRHLWSFSVEDIRNLLEPYGNVDVDIMGSKYFPIYEYHFPTLIEELKKK